MNYYLIKALSLPIFRKHHFYEKELASHRTSVTCIYKEMRRLSHLYGKHNYARSGSNVVNGLIEPQLELYLRITDMLLQGFLLRRPRICTPFASKPEV